MKPTLYSFPRHSSAMRLQIPFRAISQLGSTCHADIVECNKVPGNDKWRPGMACMGIHSDSYCGAPSMCKLNFQQQWGQVRTRTSMKNKENAQIVSWKKAERENGWEKKKGKRKIHFQLTLGEAFCGQSVDRWTWRIEYKDRADAQGHTDTHMHALTHSLTHTLRQCGTELAWKVKHHRGGNFDEHKWKQLKAAHRFPKAVGREMSLCAVSGGLYVCGLCVAGEWGAWPVLENFLRKKLNSLNWIECQTMFPLMAKCSRVQEETFLSPRPPISIRFECVRHG